jgi:hypothetical protein
MKINILFALISLFSLSTFANGNRVGNGGDIVVCPGTKEILDFYENAGAVRNFSTENTIDKVLEQVFKNLERLSPRQAKQYKNRASEFISDTEFKTGVALTDIKDSKHVFEPKDKNCSVQQIAIRRNEPDLNGKRFVVDQTLWNQLSPRGQAGLILHEVIYEHLFKLGEEDSVRARKLNAYLFSNKVFADSQDIYWKFIKDLNVPIYR